MIRHGFGTILLALITLALVPSTASAQTSAGFVQGFGGLTFGDSQQDLLFGGNVGIDVTPNIQVVGEMGYMRDTLPSLFGGIGNIALDLVGADVRLRALYGEGGVWFLTSSRSSVRGYVETTAGLARLNLNVDLPGNFFGLESIVDEVLGTVSTTQPLLGLGGGVLIGAGALQLDLGYRFKRIFTGSPIDVSQFRGAVGVGF